MTSKKLFLADCIENFKRRNWVFWIQFLALFFCFPGVLLLGLNRMNQQYAESAKLWDKLSEYTLRILETNKVIAFVIICLAVLSGIQAFSWLHQKKKVNFYHSQPVNRNCRFLIIWVNGIIGFFISYAVNLGLGMAAAASYGCLTGEAMAAVPKALLAYLLLFMAVYHVAIIAVMVTGNTLVSLVGTGILLVYEIVVRALSESLASSFFRTYNWQETEKVLNTLFSPVVTFYRYLIGMGAKPYEVQRLTYTETMFTMTGLTLLFGLAGWLLYKARPSESHGKSISFPQIKEPLKALLLLVFGTVGGLFIYSISGSSDVLGILGTVFAVALGHCIIQLIYEVDFKAILKGLPSLVIAAALSVLIFSSFRWDIFGYDKKIPAQEKVESVAINLDAGYEERDRVLSDGTEVSWGAYWKAEMKLTDLDMVYRLLNNRVNAEQFDEYDRLYRLDVVFNLKKGKTSYRTLYFNYDNNQEVMNEIFHTPEYQKNTNQVMEDNFAEEFNVFEVDYQNGRTAYAVPKEQINRLLEAYVQDVNNVNFEELRKSLPIGRLEIRGRGIQDEEYINSWRVAIYPSFTNSISLMKQCGIVTEAVCNQDYMDRIKSISISYTDYEAWEASGQPMVGDYRKEIVFADKKDEAKLADSFSANIAGVFYVDRENLKEIMDSAYLQNISHWGNTYGSENVHTDYSIQVELYERTNSVEGDSYTPEGDEEEYTYYEAYCFKANQIPEFVLNAIKEAAVN